MTFTLDGAAVIQLLVATILPILVGLVTTRVTSSGRKAWLLALLALVTSVLIGWGNAINTNEVFDIGASLIAAIPTFAIAVATHYGLWKPTGIAGTAQDTLVTSP